MSAGRGVLRTAEGSRSEAFGPGEWGLLVVTAGVWGSSFLFIAEGLEAFAPGLVTWLRLLLGVATLSLFPRAREPVARADLKAVVLLSVVWMASPLVLLPIAQQWISSSLTGMINGGMPLFAAVIASLLLRRLPGRVQMVGLAVGFAGVVLLAIPSDGATATLGGVALALLATACYGTAVNQAVPLQQRYGALPVLLRALVISLVLTTPLGLASVPASSWSWSSFAAVAALGVGGTALAYVSMATLVGRAGATRGAVAIYLLPVVALVLGVTVRGETVTRLALVGMGLALIGAIVTSRSEQRVLSDPAA